MVNTKPDDRIFPVTRLILAAVIVVLLFAFWALYFNPQNTKQNFAWAITPPLTAVFMGAGYISGAYMFVFAVFGRKWHRVKNSLLPVSAFTIAMLLATLLHYDRFLHQSPAFKLWLGIYIVTPFLVPWLWLNNRKSDPGVPEDGDKIVPALIRWTSGLIGLLTLVFWIVNYIDPPLLMAIWPWKLTPLTTRVICGWGMLISVGALILFTERRWSAWRYNLQSIALWQALMVIGSLIHRQDFTNGSLLNGYFIGILFTLVMISSLYAGMELGVPRRNQDAQSAPSI